MKFPNLSNHDVIVIALVLMVFSVSVTSTIYGKSNYADGASAEDWNRHSVWIREYLQGNFTNMSDYPPAYQIAMTPVYLLFDGSIKYFQIILSILCIASLSFLSYKMLGKIGLQYFWLCIGSSFLFMNFTFQLMPETLDFILFPILVYKFFQPMTFRGKLYKGEYFDVSFISLFLLYTHIIGIFFWAILFLYSLCFRRDYLKFSLVVLLLACPMIFINLLPKLFLYATQPFTLIGSGIWNNATETHQIWLSSYDRNFVYPIENLILWSGGVLWLLTIPTIYSMWKVKKYDEFEFFCAVWFFTFIPMLVFSIYRTTPYMVLPASLYIASRLKRLLYDKKPL